MNKQVYVINTEYFLQCNGHCEGCFLSNEERQSSQVYHEEIENSLKKLQLQQSQKPELLVIGFGRGNILNLTKKNKEGLKKLIHWCSENFQYDDILFEVSTSLIGKIDKQIESALEILAWHPKVYFNIVVDSEITSKQFWINLNQFYKATSAWRIKNRNMIEDWGDIFVLNVNPQKLPDIKFIEDFTSEFPSPVNINMFPFAEKKEICEDELIKVNEWSVKMFEALKNKDLNVKNYLDTLKEMDLSNLSDLISYQSKNKSSYHFIDKRGEITFGMPSIMGEIDFPRLLDKYKINVDFEDAYKKMQKYNACSMCDHQKQCIASGSYVNFLANHQKIQKSSSHLCPSGYQGIFKSHEV